MPLLKRQIEDVNMRSDKREVEAELRWNADIDATDVAVAAENPAPSAVGCSKGSITQNSGGRERCRD
jgi:hypothetical protein